LKKNKAYSLVVAADSNNCIGNENKLLCHLPADLQHFKAITWGHTIIMGRKTFESMNKKVLPGRETIVITRQSNYEAEGCLLANSIEQALTLTKKDLHIYIIGGADIYHQTIADAEKIYLTRIHNTFKGDSFFPTITNEDWQIEEKKDFIPNDKNKYAYSFITYSKRDKKNESSPFI